MTIQWKKSKKVCNFYMTLICVILLESVAKEITVIMKYLTDVTESVPKGRVFGKGPDFPVRRHFFWRTAGAAERLPALFPAETGLCILFLDTSARAPPATFAASLEKILFRLFQAAFRLPCSRRLFCSRLASTYTLCVSTAQPVACYVLPAFRPAWIACKTLFYYRYAHFRRPSSFSQRF
jgi:hypothetical protein